MTRFRLPLKLVVVILVFILAGTLRARAVNLLPVDYDEDDYLRAGQQFAHIIRTGEWGGFLETNYRHVHPPLAKIVFGLSILGASEQPLIPEAATTDAPNNSLSRTLLHPARNTSAWMGTLEAALLALVNPLAGLFLAVHALTIKYTSQVMLESLPALTSLLAVMAYVQYKKRQSTGWIITSAVFLGLTAASKYIYAVVGFAILTDWLLAAKRSNDLSRYYKRAILWGLLSLLIFFAVDPYLWPDPPGRLQASLFANASYSENAQEVQNAGFPFWQPFYWLFFSMKNWHPTVFLFVFDGLISLLAFLGLKRLWKRERVYVLWLAFVMGFLLIWPTKWPQYIVTLSAPLALAAAEGFSGLVVDPARVWRAGRRSRVPRDADPYQRREIHRALPWLIPGLIVFLVLTLFPMVFQYGVSLTDFNTFSIRDAFNGGLWRAIFDGLSGQIPAASSPFPFEETRVNYIGTPFYLDALAYVVDSGLLTFNTLWMIFSVALQTALGLGVALLLWQKGVRLNKFWQAPFILPWAIPEMIGALLWFNVFEPEWGWLSLAVEKYGAGIPFGFFVGWEQTTAMSMFVYLIPAVWYGFPFMMLAASAGLKLVPVEVFDATAIDGANPWQTFRAVTWPLLQPLLIPAIIIRGIFAFNQFYLFQAFFALEATLTTMSYNVFNPSGFHPLGGQFALSAVLNILNVLILVGLVTLFNRKSRADEGVTYA